MIMVKVSIEDLKYKSEFGINHGKYQNGYRIVYFYEDGNYSVGTFSGSIEGFMMDFVEMDPIEDESDIPEFISVDDLLERYLNALPNMAEVALYKTDGTCIEKKSRKKVK